VIDQLNEVENYFVEARPLDFHCHGVGRYDFAHLDTLSLDGIEQHLAGAHLDCVITLYVSERGFPRLLSLLREYSEAPEQRFRHIAGFALEGPLLSSVGGTPMEGAWRPTRNQWHELAATGSSSLRYVVLSPDVEVDPAGTGSTAAPGEAVATVDEVVEILASANISPAFGHFSKSDPHKSAAAIRRLLSIVRLTGVRTGRQTPVFSDHLLNDMPTLVTYAWRTGEQRRSRRQELDKMGLEDWRLSTLAETLGPVPATLLHAAAAGELTACLNFDGDHVDLEICRRIVELIGSDNLVAITDRVEGERLAQRDLRRSSQNSLLYQNDGIVAAGSQGLPRQQENMRKIGLSEVDIWKLSALTANRCLGRTNYTGFTLVRGSTASPADDRTINLAT
jgi:N-acetylglucosamine-6-phosphate deacetylase